MQGVVEIEENVLNYAAIVVYTHMPFAIYTVASSLADQDQPTHHTI